MKNYHRILGVSEDAEPEEIKAAYRKLAKKYHPDSHPDDPNIKKKFQEISEAYEALRKEWSRYGHFQSSFREEPRPKWSFHREIRIPVHLELEETLVEVEKDVTYLIRLSHDLGYEMLKCRIKIPGGAYQYKKIPLQDVICEGQEEYDKIKEKLEYFSKSKKTFKFNNLGLFACWFKVKFPRKYKRVCSQFVSECVDYACPEIILPKHYWIMQPEDFKFAKNIDLMYRGNMSDIPVGLSEEEILTRIEQLKDYDPNKFGKKRKK